MILAFGSKETEKIWNGNKVKGLPNGVQEVGRRKLRMLNNSQDYADLMIPPANRLEKLSGKWNAFYSIRINDQWRIVFRWENNNALEVEIMDYHYGGQGALIIKFNKMSSGKKLKNIHPGEVLQEEFLLPLGISAYRLSKDTAIPQTRISEIVKGNRRVTADTALRLSRYFGTSAKFWLGLQDDYDLEEEGTFKEKELMNIKHYASEEA